MTGMSTSINMITRDYRLRCLSSRRRLDVPHAAEDSREVDKLCSGARVKKAEPGGVFSIEARILVSDET